jgi:hypothetical protein
LAKVAWVGVIPRNLNLDKMGKIRSLVFLTLCLLFQVVAVVVAPEMHQDKLVDLLVVLVKVEVFHLELAQIILATPMMHHLVLDGDMLAVLLLVVLNLAVVAAVVLVVLVVMEHLLLVVLVVLVLDYPQRSVHR